MLGELQAQAPLDINEDLVSFGPSFGEEALLEFISRLEKLGLVYVDDFVSMAFDLPTWCRIRVELPKE
jgi:hypothetical protein